MDVHGLAGFGWLLAEQEELGRTWQNQTELAEPELAEPGRPGRAGRILQSWQKFAELSEPGRTGRARHSWQNLVELAEMAEYCRFGGGVG